MANRTCNVLFLCTGNSARSIMAEVLLNAMGGGRFRAHSAGSHPNGRVNPFSLETLQSLGLRTEGLRSKSWDEFAQPNAEPIDIVITVCDNAAGEVCPVWPGKPFIDHWSVEDPVAVQGPDEVKRAAFRATAMTLKERIERLLSR